MTKTITSKVPATRTAILRDLAPGSYFRCQTNTGRICKLVDTNICEARVEFADQGKTRREGWSLETVVVPIDAPTTDDLKNAVAESKARRKVSTQPAVTIATTPAISIPAPAGVKAAKATKATPEPVKATKGKGKKVEPETEKAETNGSMSGTRIKVLQLLAKAPEGLTRKDLADSTGIAKGWAKILGAPTKEGGDVGGMEGDGLVESSAVEGQRALVYTITPAGRKALTAATK